MTPIPNLPRQLQELAYEQEAQEYLRSLPLEHFMEATAQARQRAITLASLALVTARRPEVQVFNELLVQWPLPGGKPVRGHYRLGKVVPDNMVVLAAEPVQAETSFNLSLERARPFWVLEYVSKTNPRKDYEDNFRKYEADLKVPFYLLFYPEAADLTLYQYTRGKYVSVKPNRAGRLAIRKLELEMALLDDWVRYWFRGELLPLPADLQRDLDEARRRLEQSERRAEEERRRAEELQRRLEAAERELAALRNRPGPR